MDPNSSSKVNISVIPEAIKLRILRQYFDDLWVPLKWLCKSMKILVAFGRRCLRWCNLIWITDRLWWRRWTAWFWWEQWEIRALLLRRAIVTLCCVARSHSLSMWANSSDWIADTRKSSACWSFDCNNHQFYTLRSERQTLLTRTPSLTLASCILFHTGDEYLIPRSLSLSRSPSLSLSLTFSLSLFL